MPLKAPRNALALDLRKQRKTYAEIAAALGVSVQRAREICIRAGRDDERARRWRSIVAEFASVTRKFREDRADARRIAEERRCGVGLYLIGRDGFEIE